MSLGVVETVLATFTTRPGMHNGRDVQWKLPVPAYSTGQERRLKEFEEGCD